MVYSSGQISSFCVWLSSFPNIIYGTDHSFLIVYPWLFCCKFIDHMSGFTSELFILLICASVFNINTILFWITVAL